jgi:hypothetical protein
MMRESKMNNTNTQQYVYGPDSHGFREHFLWSICARG